tara:strand:- start:381 stop:518 length:138 start_codon:yes stop_codon:yes gene_type:complete
MYATSTKVAKNLVKKIDDKNELCKTILSLYLTGNIHLYAETINKI